MSEMILYKCPNTSQKVLLCTSHNICPYCNEIHEYPNQISKKKDDKWHKKHNMWIEVNKKDSNPYKKKNT